MVETPKRKVPQCNLECGAVFHMTGGSHTTDCRAYEPPCPTCHSPRPDLHPDPSREGVIQCPDPFHEVEYVEPV